MVLLILDGWGVAPPGPGNAIAAANLPTYNRLLATTPNTTLQAAGEAVGLPPGEVGNSEVGHLNIGAGRIVYQDLPRINLAISDGSFLTNRVLRDATLKAKTNKSKLHLMGLAGSAGVHASLEHLYALLWLIKEQSFANVWLHLFTDGRDSPPTLARVLLPQIEERLRQLGVGRIASVSGRYFAMDRDEHWDRTQSAYNAIASGKGLSSATTAEQVVASAYQRGQTDEFIDPTVITSSAGRPLATVDEGDVLISFNFRSDRIRQLTQAFTERGFNKFPIRSYTDLTYVCMTSYDSSFNLPVAFPPEEIKLPLARVISEAGLSQLHLAETEKYPHVTYFLNGGREDPYPREQRILIPSPKVATYDLEPTMSTPAITETLVKKIRDRSYDFYVANIACPDMVGHTGNLAATIKAVEAVDPLLHQVVNNVLAQYGAVVITGDHGNAEAKLDPAGQVLTAHTTNPVPFIAVSRELLTSNQKQLTSGVLADVAPTILSLMGLAVPSSMTGHNLILELI